MHWGIEVARKGGVPAALVLKRCRRSRDTCQKRRSLAAA
ncbi:hypothetical protein ABIF69_004852 [Bradyrhizobium japonicum]